MFDPGSLAMMAQVGWNANVAAAAAAANETIRRIAMQAAAAESPEAAGHGPAAGHGAGQGRAVQVDPIKPQLKARLVETLETRMW